MNKYIIIILTILTSCGTVTQRIPNKMMITHLNNLPCDSSESNQIFFTYVDGEKINFEYQPLALINIENGNNLNQDLLFEMKRIALEQCADGIINLKQDLNQGHYSIDQYVTNSNNYRPQVVPFVINKYSGIAVKLVKNDSLSQPRYDTSFVNNFWKNDSIRIKNLEIYEKKFENEAKSAAGAGAFWGFIGLVSLGLYVYLELKYP